MRSMNGVLRHWRIPAIILTLVVLIVAFSGFPSLLPERFASIVGDAILTVGGEGVAYAAAPDYLVDGEDDHVQILAMLDDLPSTGGKIILYAYNYSFSAAPSRAIDNVTVEGSGAGTYISYNGSSPVLSAGNQSGWLFTKLSTDAGGITRNNSSGSYVINCWIDGEFTNDIDSILLSSTAIVFSNDTPTAIKNVALNTQRVYGDLVQVCDGVDDHLNYQAARNALGSTGGTITFGAGGFDGESLIINHYGIELEGCGEATTYTLKNGVNDSIIKGNGSTLCGIKIHNFIINGNKDNQSAGYGIDISGFPACEIYSMRIKEAKSHGIYGNQATAPCNTAFIHHNKITLCEGSGVYLLGVYGTKVESNYIGQNGGNGVLFSGGAENNVFGNSLPLNDGYGFRLYSTDRCVVNGNPYIGWNGKQGGLVDHNSTDCQIVNNGILENCADSGDAGLEIGNATRTFISANKIHKADETGQLYGIRILAAAIDTAVINNDLGNNQVDGLTDAGTGSIIRDNIGYPDYRVVEITGGALYANETYPFTAADYVSFHGVTFYVPRFDADGGDIGTFWFELPPDFAYQGDTTVTYHFTAITKGATSGTVVGSLKLATSNSALAGAEAKTAMATFVEDEEWFKSSESTAITIAGSPAEGVGCVVEWTVTDSSTIAGSDPDPYLIMIVIMFESP